MCSTGKMKHTRVQVKKHGGAVVNTLASQEWLTLLGLCLGYMCA